MNLFDSASLVVTPNAYKTSKLYSIVPSDGTGDMTFSRTGDTATRVNSSGLIESVLANKPRLDYLGSTCPRLLVEPQRTNLGLYSDDFNQATWTTNSLNTTITSNSIISPDGTTNADSILTTTTNGDHYIQQRTGSATSGITYTISCFVKKLGYDYCYLSVSNTASANGTFRFSTKTLTLSGAQVVANSGRVDELANGWFRISFSVLPITSSTFRWSIWCLNDSGNFTYIGDVTKGLYVWGFQFEVGSFATSYIPTTTASVTRNADSCLKTGITSLIGQTEGTLFFDLNLDSRISYTYLMIRNSTTSIYIGLLINDSFIRMEVRNDAATQAAITFSNTSTGRYKCALAYKANDFVFYVNGDYKGADTSGTVPSVDIFDIYFNATNNIKINSSAIWKTRLTNSELATLTTI